MCDTGITGRANSPLTHENWRHGQKIREYFQRERNLCGSHSTVLQARDKTTDVFTSDVHPEWTRPGPGSLRRVLT